MDVHLEQLRAVADSTAPGADHRDDRAFRPAAVLPAIDRFRRRLSLLRYGHRDDHGVRSAEDALTLLWTTRGVEALLPRMLAWALDLTGAQLGNLQLANAESGVLEIVTQVGFGREFLDYFAAVDDDHSACGRAARLRAQTVVTDTAADPDFRPHSEIADASGFRAVQSTPLIDRSGMLIGMISTHEPRPGRPSDEDLRTLRIYGRLAGEALSQISASAADESLDGFAALLPVLAELEAGKTALGRLADLAIHRMHAMSLDLSALQTDLTDHLLHIRLAGAVAELDHALRDLRTEALRAPHE